MQPEGMIPAGKEKVQADGSKQSGAQYRPRRQRFYSEKTIIDNAQEGQREEDGAPAPFDDAADQNGDKPDGYQNGPKAYALQISCLLYTSRCV